MPEIGHLFSTIKRILFNTRTAAPDSSFFPLDMGTADNEYKVYVSENGPLRYGSESVYRGDYLLSIKNFNDAIEAFTILLRPTASRTAFIFSSSFLSSKDTLPTII